MDGIPKPWHPLSGDVNSAWPSTFADLGSLLLNIFFLPGDWSIWFLVEFLPNQAQSLNVDAGDYGGLLSGFVSGTAWLIVLLSLWLVWHFARKVYETVFYGTQHWVEKGKSRVRVATIRQRTRSKAPARQSTGVTVSSESSALSLSELKLLRAHSNSERFARIKPEQLAAVLGLPADQLGLMISKLTTMGLLAGPKEHGGYALTEAGDAYLSFNQPP